MLANSGLDTSPDNKPRAFRKHLVILLQPRERQY